MKGRRNIVNNVAFFEIHSNNVTITRNFYQTIFDLQFEQQEGLPVEYRHIKTAGINGGLLQRPTPLSSSASSTNAFTCSIEVENFDTTAKNIMDHGGRVALEKFAVPGKCWQGYFLDPDQDTLGILEVNTSAA